MADVLLSDIDGTLVDSDALHVRRRGVVPMSTSEYK